MRTLGIARVGSQRIDKPKVKVHLWDQMVLIGIALAVFYTIFDSVLYIFLSYDVDFFGRLFGPDISVIWTRLTILALLLLLGSHAQFTINQRKATEEALKESEEKYRTIIENTEDGYFEVDTSGRLVFLNEAMCNILGYTRQELSAMDGRIPLEPQSKRKIVRTLRTVFKTGTPVKSIGWEVVRHNDTRCFVESSVSLVKNSAGRIIGFSGFTRDVTERKHAEVLQQAKLSAEAANRAKSDFIAKMSHEIRTPLNSIIGMVELTLGTDLKSHQRDDLDVALSAAYALLAIINNILDFSKIEAGKLTLEESPFKPREILEEASRIMAMRCHTKGLELVCRVDRSVPERLHGDPARFRQVLLNLVDNAHKFTKKGHIVVNMAWEGDRESDHRLHVSVTDTGPGIPKNKQEDIFKAFAQADAVTSGRYGGAGLGLAVSDQLVRLMGGDMWVRSDTGEGCTFHFTCRFREMEGDTDATSSSPEPSLLGKRILIIDDNSVNCRVQVETLESFGMVPTAVMGAEEAKLTINRATTTSQPFQIALLDVSLADKTGLDLALWIKQLDGIDLPIIAMLTYPDLQLGTDLEALGVVAALMKPVRPLELHKTLVAIHGATSEKAEYRIPSPKAKLKTPGHPLNILVAEDTVFNQKYIKRLLERWGQNATIVENGRQVLEVLPQGSFDLVLMDVQMPVMNGYEATQAIRNTEKSIGGGVHMPIVAMTALAIKGDRERCLEAGMDEYLSKPISPGKLHDIISRIEADKSHRQESDISNDEGDSDRFKAHGLDRKLIDEAFDHDRGFFKEVFDLFVADYPLLMDSLNASLTSGDAVALSRYAHSIKGMVGLFKAEEAYNLAQLLEKKGKEGDLAGLSRILARLSDSLEQLKVDLTEIAGESSDEPGQ